MLQAKSPVETLVRTRANNSGFVMQKYSFFCSLLRLNPRETEGVGFEPTVGFPTLDFESSALNRTRPPLR